MKETNNQKAKQSKYNIPTGNGAASGAMHGMSNGTANNNANGTVITMSESDIPAVTDLARIISRHCRTHRLSVMRLIRTFSPGVLELQKVLRTFHREQVEAALTLLCDWEEGHNSVVDEKLFLPIVMIDDGTPRLMVITNIGEPKAPAAPQRS